MEPGVRDLLFKEGLHPKWYKWKRLRGYDIPRKTRRGPIIRVGPAEGEVILLFEDERAHTVSAIPSGAKPYVITYPSHIVGSESLIDVAWCGPEGGYCIRPYSVLSKGHVCKVDLSLKDHPYPGIEEPEWLLRNELIAISVHAPYSASFGYDGGHGYGVGGRD